AHKYKPEGCLLAYNDYNEYNDGKVDAIYNLAKDLYEKGWLDALGMQGHLTVPDNPTIARFRAALEKFSTIGCKIMVTELDAQRGSGGDLEQAEYYQELFETLVEFSDKIEAVVFWGNHDGVSWRRTSYPLLFDSNYQPKEAYYSVLDVLSDHEHEFERTVIEPTCTEEGQVIDTCTICGRTIVRERPKKLGHDWDEGVITTQPTETETGVRTYTCKRCGETKTGRVPRIGATTPDDIDFTNPADADKFEVVNKDTAEIASGIGLTLTPTADAFEPIGGGFGGGAATESEPKDLIKVPVSGDWTATLKFDYDPNNVTFAFSTYFSFLAMEGDDYQNMAGIRATNSVAQDYLRKDGEIATPTISGGGFGQQGPQTGFTAAGTFYYKMEKAGDSYTFYRGVPAGTRGPEDVEFEEIFKLEDTGIEAEYIVIDAYKTSTFSFGGTDSWLFTLQSLEFEDGGAPAEQLKPGPNVVKDPESPTGYTVKFLYENPDAQSVVFAGDIGLRNWADTSDEQSYTPFEYKPGFMRAGSWQADMVKREDGYWYIEVPLAAGANQYWFYVDGNTRRMMPDPNNAPKWSPASSATKNAYNAVYVPYDEKQDFEPMKAREAENPRADQKGTWEYVPIQIGENTRYMGVYTPYGYDPEGDKVYKTIYAVHGGGQDESDWMGIGSVQNIMDNLAAEGRTEPAFIVTPASANFGTDFANLFGVMVAYMEENFKVSSDPQDRAFCGLSAGGGQTRSLIISSHADQFGYYGPWSSSNTNDGYAAAGDLSTAHIMFGVGYHDPMERRHLTEATMNELKDKGAYVVNEIVAGAHDFNAWCQLFRIFCEKYLWQPEAFGDTGEPEIPDSEKGLKDFFKDYFRIGTATEVAQVNSEVGREFMLKHFNSVTCENDMKPQHTLDQAGSQAAGDNITVKVQLNDNARTIL
ncbi:MAG: endo-1,4-beta-xylanase, partial [Oscillospiraceae bacterium]|nr:endo-1,4-beta-xylanase [Oscillospiraceae bacterium]